MGFIDFLILLVVGYLVYRILLRKQLKRFIYRSSKEEGKYLAFEKAISHDSLDLPKATQIALSFNDEADKIRLLRIVYKKYTKFVMGHPDASVFSFLESLPINLRINVAGQSAFNEYGEKLINQYVRDGSYHIAQSYAAKLGRELTESELRKVIKKSGDLQAAKELDKRKNKK